MLAKAGQLPGFLDAAVTAASRRREVFEATVEIGLGRGTVPVELLATVARGWVGSRLSRGRR